MEKILHHPTHVNIELGGTEGALCIMRLWSDVVWVVQDCFHQPTGAWAFGETLWVNWVNFISSREGLACASAVRCHTDRFVSFMMGQSQFQSSGSGMCLCRTLSYRSIRLIALSLVVSETYNADQTFAS